MGGWAIAVHGGAGVDPNLPQQRQEEAKQLLTRCLNLGISALRSNLPAIDVVELVVRLSLSLSVCVGFSNLSPSVSLSSVMSPCSNLRHLNHTKEIGRKKSGVLRVLSLQPHVCISFPLYFLGY